MSESAIFKLNALVFLEVTILHVGKLKIVTKIKLEFFSATCVDFS